MKDILVDSDLPVTLLGGGEATPSELTEVLSLAPCLVAADGGAGVALAAGQMPQAVIGDMDSLSPDARARIPAARLHRIAEQESTDFDKALRSIRAPFVLGVGFLGERVDHQLANFTVLVRRPSPPCLLLGPRDVIFAAPEGREIGLDVDAGCRVSLYPLGPVRGRSTGLTWPIDGIDFAPNGTIGTSNRARGPVQLAFDAPGMLVILPRAALPAALTGLGL